jgi:hypothetical protein
VELVEVLSHLRLRARSAYRENPPNQEHSI